VRVDQFTGPGTRQPNRHRVDREVASRKIVIQGRRDDDRKGSGFRIPLAPGRDEVDVPVAVRKFDHGCSEAGVGDNGCPQAIRYMLRNSDRVTLDDQVDIVEMIPPEQGVADQSTDDADLPRQVRQHTGDHRMGSEALVEVDTIRHVSWDPLSEKLVENSPLRTPELVAAFTRHEHLTITELDGAWDQINVAFREWVEQPENAGRPIQDAPQYWDRIAIDSLRERRTWWE